MTSKEKEVIMRLLRVYKRMSFLWDTNHSDYKNRKLRSEGMEVLLKIYRKCDPNANIKTVTKKISNLRTNYYREIKKVNNSILSGGDVYTPSVFYYDALTFLNNGDVGADDDCDADADADDTLITSNDPLDEPRETYYLSTTSSEPGSPSETQTNYESKGETKTKPKRMKPNIPQFLSSNSNEEQDNFASTSTPKMKDEDWIVLGKSIGLQLRDINKEQLAIANKLIADTIYYAKFGRLTENSFVELGPPSEDYK